MEKIALFVSDIQGTLPNKNSEDFEKMDLFFSNLDDVRKLSGASKLLFTLSSTGSKDEVLEKMDELREFMEGKDIEFANQYSAVECFSPEGDTVLTYEPNLSKASLMIDQMTLLQENYDISWAGFADDLGEMYINIMDIQNEFPNIPTTIIYPEFPLPLSFDSVIGAIDDSKKNFESGRQK